MKIVKVTYTCIAEYKEQNKTNIQKVMADLKAIGNNGIRYECFVNEENNSFTHLAVFEKEEFQKTLLELPSFNTFQNQLKDGKLLEKPLQESLSLIGSSHGSIF